MFDSAGIKNPGVRQVIREAERIIRIEPQLDYSSIHAGEGFTIHALAYYAVDNRPVPRGNNIDLEFFQDEGYLGTETQSAALGQYITWTAPSSAGKYGIQVDLSEDSKSAGWRLQQGKPATASYIVGAPTRFALKPSSVRIATTRRQPLNIEVILQDEKGNTFSSGDLIIDVRPGNQFGLQVPESYLDPRPVLELPGTDLSSLRNIQLVPLETAVIEPGPVHVSASYRDGSSRMANATAILRVQEPRIVDGSRIVVKTREKDGNVDMAVYVSDETEQKVRVGTVTVTALSGGLFRTHRGSAHDVTLDLSRPGYATWMPGKEETKSQIFRIAFSGGAWQDAMYSPVTTEWTLNMKDKKEETPLFTGTEPPAEPHEIQAPSDEIYIAETGYQVEVSHNEWKKVEEEQVPIVLIPDRKGPSAGNLFAGTEKPVPEETEKAGQGAGNLFFGEQFGIKGAEPVKKESLPASSSKTEAPLGGSLFAGIDAPVASSDYNEDKAAPLDDSEQLPADDPNMRELIIQSVKITNDSGLERPLSAGQTARIYLVTRWNGSFMERVRIKIKVDQFTALDEIHEFRDSMGTYKTDFMKKIIIPDEIIEKSLGIHNIQVTCELVPVSNPKIKLICKPYSTEFMMVKPGKKLDIKILK